MRILAVDTSSKICSVSLLENDRLILELNNEDEKTHSQKLMPLVDELFARTNCDLDHLDLLCCCLGPGSFTGVRIGIATIKAFADVKKIPVLGVTSLEGLCYGVDSKTVCSIIDAKHDNVYVGLFQQKEDFSYEKRLEKACTFDEMVTILQEQKIDDVTFVGDGVDSYLEKIVQNFENCKIAADELNQSSSVSIAKAAYTRYKKGETGTSLDLHPVYLKKSQAERELDGEK